MTDYISRDKEVIWHPFTQLGGSMDPISIVKAEGIYLYTEDEKKIIDAISSWWVNLHGHSHPAIAKAVEIQSKTLEHVIFAGFTHPPAIELAEKLLSILPSNQSKIFYSDNGSTAVEVALKMTFQYWYNQGIDRKKVIAFNGAYHGDTFGSMSVGDRGPFSAPFSPFLFDVSFIDCPNEANFENLFSEFKNFIDKGDVAAFIFEPLVLGSAGMLMYSPEHLDQMIAYAQQQDVVCIADEVFTGFGRTGKLFASDYLHNKPDIFALSKGLTGGTMAMGVTSCTADIINAYRSNDIMKTFFHGHSFTANPIACAASIASFNLLMMKECVHSIENITKWHHEVKLKWEVHPKVKEVRQLGTILALELLTNESSSYVNEVRHRLYPFFVERGVLLRPLGNVIYVLPPYVITKNEIVIVYNAIEALLASEII